MPPRPPVPPKRLGDLLIDSGLITQEQLQLALREQKRTGERLGRTLIKMGMVSEQDIMNVLEMQLGIPQIQLNKLLDVELVRSFPEELIRRTRIVPVKKEGQRLIVALADPLNVVAQDDFRVATRLDITPMLTTESEIDQAISKAFAMADLEREFAGPAPEETGRPETIRISFQENMGAGEAPVIRLVNSIFAQAVNERASDIHIEPREKGLLVRFRVDGILRDILELPAQARIPVISRLKILSGMDIAERRLPQDGRLQLDFSGRSIDMRVSSLPTVYGEKIVLRLLYKSDQLFDLHQLGFSTHNLERFRSVLKAAYGLILLTGPTGSGKTTTLYAALRDISSAERNIITIEDPVEYLLPGVNQTQVNVRAGLTFATGLRAILRQDPDVIMVGEIRDTETAEIAVRAATTGHLVLSTLHTNDAVGAVGRLIDMGVDHFLVAASLLGVTAQRLVRLLCPYCKQPYQPGPEDRLLLGPHWQEGTVLYQPAGCPQCHHTGYKGRTGIHEVLLASGVLREMINNRRPHDVIKKQAAAEGMVLLQEDGIQKVLQGLTSLQEVMRVAYTRE